MSSFRRDEKLSLGGISTLRIGLSWECFKSRTVDFDASCALFDEKGKFKELVYFQNLVDASESVQHSGDSRTGSGGGDDEELIIHLDKLPRSIGVLVVAVNSYSGDSFGDVSRATVRLVNISPSVRSGGQELGRFSLSVTGSMGRCNAMIMSKIYRTFRGWEFHAIGQGSEGKSFGDLLPDMQACLRDIIPSVKIEPKPDVIVLTKGESVNLETKGQVLDDIVIGLGWDVIDTSTDSAGGSGSGSVSRRKSVRVRRSTTGALPTADGDTKTPYASHSDSKEAVDLDTSCVMFDERGEAYDVVYFNQLSNSNGSVRHGGDNTTGEGEGDDEQIFVKLSEIPRECTSLFFVVTSYSGHFLSRVKNAYIRLLDHSKSSRSTPSEIIRFQLTKGGNDQETSMIMCRIYLPGKVSSFSRKTAVWKMKAMGHASNGKTYKDCTSDMKSEILGELRLKATTPFRYTPKPYDPLDDASEDTGDTGDATSSSPATFPSTAAASAELPARGGASPAARILLILGLIFLLAMLSSQFFTAKKSTPTAPYDTPRSTSRGPRDERDYRAQTDRTKQRRDEYYEEDEYYRESEYHDSFDHEEERPRRKEREQRRSTRREGRDEEWTEIGQQ